MRLYVEINTELKILSLKGNCPTSALRLPYVCPVVPWWLSTKLVSEAVIIALRSEQKFNRATQADAGSLGFYYRDDFITKRNKFRGSSLFVSFWNFDFQEI